MRWFWCATSNLTRQSVKSFMIQSLGPTHFNPINHIQQRHLRQLPTTWSVMCLTCVALLLAQAHCRADVDLLWAPFWWASPTAPGLSNPNPKKSFSPTKQWLLKFLKIKKITLSTFLSLQFFFSQFDRLRVWVVYNYFHKNSPLFLIPHKKITIYVSLI